MAEISKIVIASLTGVAYSDGSCDVITVQDRETDFNDAMRGMGLIARDIGRQIKARQACPFYKAPTK
jgi:hypothetical protein